MFESHRMRRIGFMTGISAFWMSVCLLSGMMSSAATAESALRIAYPVFSPFHWTLDHGGMTGFFYEILTEALEKRMGLTVVWTAYPWPRCQDNLKTGKDDAVITVPTAERAAFTATHRTPFYIKTIHIFTCLDHLRFGEIKNIKTIADLKSGGFSVITYSGNSWHKENVQSMGIKTHESPSLENVWKMLSEKRGDVVLEWPPGAWPDIRKAGVSDRIVDTDIRISEMPFHLLIRRDAPQVRMLPDFDETIHAMITDGTIKVIASKYF